MTVLGAHKFGIRSAAKVAITVLLLASVGIGLANLLKADSVPTDKSWETSQIMERIAGVSESFATEFYTFDKNDITWETRVKPYTASPFKVTDRVNMTKITKAQVVKQAWVRDVNKLVGDVYSVRVDIIAGYKDAKGKDMNRYMTATIPVEVSTDNNQVAVIGNPALVPTEPLADAKGIVIDKKKIAGEISDNISVTIKTFMQQLTGGTSSVDLQNFVSGKFAVQPLDKSIKFLGFKNFSLFVNNADENGNPIDWIAVADVALKDSATGQIFSPTYIYTLVQKEGKYYITWMSNQ